MPEFVYRGDEGRTYFPPGQPPVAPVPGETYTLRRDPGDGRWEPASKPAKKTPRKPAKKPPARAGETKE